jgi:hypothetical protein
VKKRSVWRWAPAFAGLSSLFAAIPAIAQGSVQWGCDAPVGRTCYFSIQFAGGGVRNFSLLSGRKTMVGGVTPGRDQYLVSIDAPNMGDIARCRQLIAVGRVCQAKVVDPNYND